MCSQTTRQIIVIMFSDHNQQQTQPTTGPVPTVVGGDTFSKVGLSAKHQWNSVQLVPLEHQNNFKCMKKWFLIMLLCTFCLQRDYKGETGRDGFSHFLGWPQFFGFLRSWRFFWHQSWKLDMLVAYFKIEQLRWTARRTSPCTSPGSSLEGKTSSRLCQMFARLVSKEASGPQESKKSTP